MSDMQRVQMFLGTPHLCGYLPQLTARNAYVDPAFRMDSGRYQWLVQNGFRRSGAHVYRPHCADCQRCMPVRIATAEFRASRSQRRCIARNGDLKLNVVDDLADEHYELYRRYLAARHPGAGMDADNRDAFHSFLECPWGKARFWEFRADQRLLAVAVVDVLPRALSAVYTFFDPAESARSLGTYAVLAQIAHARELGLQHVYLGYWVSGSRKMDYKKNFHPLELLQGLNWRAQPPPPLG